MTFLVKRVVVALLFLPLAAPAQQVASERVVANDNRQPAGNLRNGVLELTIEIRKGRWYPQSDSGASVEIEAFAEAGRQVSNPGPLIRVPEGTEIHITLRNTLGRNARVFGLVTRPVEEDEGILVAPHSERSLRFKAGAPGSYYYWATTTDKTIADRGDIDSQLAGAFIVDSKSSRGNDRVFVMGLWFQEAAKIDGVERPEREVLVINGKGWPYTERPTFTVGDTVTWRWLNPTTSTHPMHLHGFYYNVMSRGRAGADTIYSVADRRMVNTELMQVGSTMTMSFVPTTPGNWLFHCHFAFHVSTEASLDFPPAQGAGDDHAEHANSKAHAMAGLVLGFHVNPRPGETYASSVRERRNLRLLLQTSPNRFGDKPAYGYVLQDKSNVPKADSVALPAPTLILKRGEPVRITLVNNLREPSTVHWHGIELESFPDGVADWSGIGTRLMKQIAPADSFVAEFTPPRAGTFIYHSHINEGLQINSGMYGALLVVDDPQAFDAQHDKVILVGGGGPIPPPGLDTPGLVNGSHDPEPIVMNAGETYRLRLINIHPDWRVEFTLGTDTTVSKWKPVAKDGGDLPQSQRTMRFAHLVTGPGETADFEFTPAEPGALRLVVKTRVAGWTIPVDIDVVRTPSGGR